MFGLLRKIYINALPGPLKQIARGTYLRAGATIYRMRHPGADCQCNFCGFQAGKFMPGGYREGVLFEKQVIGGGYRPNGRCPQCYSLDRERQILIVLQNHLSLNAESRVLHVAPERNLNDIMRKTFTNQIEECDLDPEAYAWAPAISKQDLTDLKFDDERFDLILCNHVLEHIPDDRRAMAELFRVLKKGAYAILQIPYSESIPTTAEDLTVTSKAQRLKLYGQETHVRMYQRDDFIQRVESQEFESRFLGPDEFASHRQFGLDDREGIFLFQKRL